MTSVTWITFWRSIKCCRFTWILSGHDWLLLENISHVSVERPFWRAASLRGQTFHWVDEHSWEDSGTPSTHTHIYTNMILYRENPSIHSQSWRERHTILLPKIFNLVVPTQEQHNTLVWISLSFKVWIQQWFWSNCIITYYKHLIYNILSHLKELV